MITYPLTPGKLYYLKLIPAYWVRNVNMHSNIKPGVYMLTNIVIMPMGGAIRTIENTRYWIYFLIGMKEVCFTLTNSDIKNCVRQSE